MKTRFLLSLLFSFIFIAEINIGTASYRPEERWLDERPRPLNILTYPVSYDRLPEQLIARKILGIHPLLSFI